MICLAGLIVINPGLAQVNPSNQVGPGNQGATMRLPWENSAPTNNPSSTVSAFSPGMPVVPSAVQPLPNYQPKPDPNQDLFVTTAQGPWMICVTCYSGPESPQVAREMIVELRAHYHLSAYVFSKNDEERRQEFARVKKVVEDYHRFCLEKGYPLDPHMRVKTRQIQLEYAILVGNYKDADAAHRDLDKIRKLPPPQNKNLCPVALYTEVDKKKMERSKTLSPFSNVFVVHNPAIKQERPADWGKPDMAVLQKLNRGENYTLLNCKKKYTLLVKQFLVPAETKSASGSVFGKFTLIKTPHIDTQAINAHNMAELLHKTTHLDAYVLHTEFMSMVTVGAFDSPDDPALRATQQTLANQYKIPMPVPMPVPH
jgi:hypothetical protein